MSEQSSKQLSPDVDPKLLLEAFEKFTLTSQMMEKAYEKLQQQVEELNLELEEKNQELSDQLVVIELARNQLSDVLSSLPVAVAVFNGDGQVERMNQDAEQLFAFEPNQANGLSLAELFEKRFSGLPQLARLLEAKDLVSELEIGDLDWSEACVLRVSTNPMRGIDGGKGEGRILIAEDITEQARHRRDAARTDRLAAMGEMAVQIVHEIRNPMGSIELFASMLQRDLVGNPEHAELAFKVQAGIRGLNHVIGNLLSFAKGTDPVKERVDLESVIDSALSDLAHQIERQKIKLNYKHEPQAKYVQADAELWRQVMLNLILNAVQAMPDGGELSIGTRRENTADGSWMVLSLMDTGVGMAPEIRERVFHPFFTTKDRGTGLGLALVHNIVKSHGGSITVESSVGKGSTFSIMLPD